MLAVLSIAFPVFGLILTGAVAGRARFMGAQATGVLDLFMVYLALPAVLAQALARIHPADLGDSGLLLAFGTGIVVPFIIALVWARRGGTGLADSAIQALSATYCNAGYMGIPLCLTAFGEPSVVPAVTWVIAFHLVQMPPVWADTALVMSALPTGTGAFILAKLYGREAATTSGTVLVSTIMSFATLSVLLAWMSAG